MPRRSAEGAAAGSLRTPEFRACLGWQASARDSQVIFHEWRVSYHLQTDSESAEWSVVLNTGREPADLSAEAPKARRPM